jgi:hypothetical protein
VALPRTFRRAFWMAVAAGNTMESRPARAHTPLSDAHNAAREGRSICSDSRLIYGWYTSVEKLSLPLLAPSTETSQYTSPPVTRVTCSVATLLTLSRDCSCQAVAPGFQV